MRLATALTVLLLTACRPSAEPVRIGLAGPFSDPVGGPMRKAAELAVEEINAAGGIGGRPIELIARDDSGDPDSAVSVAADLVAEGVVAVQGGEGHGLKVSRVAVSMGTGEDGRCRNTEYRIQCHARHLKSEFCILTSAIFACSAMREFPPRAVNQPVEISQVRLELRVVRVSR